MTESTLSRSGLASRRAEPISRHASRTLRAAAVVAVLTTAGAAWNGAVVAAAVWLLAAASGRAASPSLLLNLAAATSTALLIPIGLIVGITIRTWLATEDRLAERRLG